MAKDEKITKIKYLRIKKCTDCKSADTEIKPIGVSYYHPTKGVPYQEKQRNTYSFAEACNRAPFVHLVCNNCNQARNLNRTEINKLLIYEKQPNL